MTFPLVVAALLLLPTAAFAQGSQGPFAGLFGRTPERTGTVFTTLDFRASGGTQWDDALLDSAQGPDAPVYAGHVGNVTGAVSFQRQSERIRVDARSAVEYRQTIEARPIGGTSVDTGLTLSVRPATRIELSGAAAYRYTPFFQFHPSFLTLDSGRSMPGLPYVATAIPHTSTLLSGAVTSHYSKRSSLSFSATRNETNFSRRPEGDVSMDAGHVRWMHRLSRSLHLRLGYGRETWRQSAVPDAAFRQEEIEAGVDLQRTFSVWRRTSVAFTSQTVFWRRLDSRGRFRVNGSASLARRFYRTWEMTLAANRGSEFVAGFTEPVFSDYGSLSAAGQLTGRIQSATVVTAGRGEFGFDDATPGDFFTGSAATMLNVAMTPKLGLFAQAGFYRYDTPAGASTVAAVNRLSRRTFMFGLTTYLPLITRERGPSDSR